jgi:hypothetical protein
VTGAPDTFDPPPPDNTALRADAVIIRPDLPLFDFGPDQRKWAVDVFSEGGRDYDFMVDRDKQLWWPSYSGETGFRGRWGPRVEKDPFHGVPECGSRLSGPCSSGRWRPARIRRCSSAAFGG